MALEDRSAAPDDRPNMPSDALPTQGEKVHSGIEFLRKFFPKTYAARVADGRCPQTPDALHIAKGWHVYQAWDVHPYVAKDGHTPVGPHELLGAIRILEAEVRRLREAQ